MIISALITVVVYLAVPDILTPVETVLFLWAGYVVSLMTVFWVQERIEEIRAKRESLMITRNRRRHKVIDFPVRGRIKHIPAFKVAE